MISRSNIVDGSKPYIVEDRPMISRSSGDRGESTAAPCILNDSLYLMSIVYGGD
jgi:hypothetical protein